MFANTNNVYNLDIYNLNKQSAPNNKYQKLQRSSSEKQIVEFATLHYPLNKSNQKLGQKMAKA